MQAREAFPSESDEHVNYQIEWCPKADFSVCMPAWATGHIAGVWCGLHDSHSGQALKLFSHNAR